MFRTYTPTAFLHSVLRRTDRQTTLPLILPIQQPPVFGDFQLQASLEVQQHVVLLLVVSNVSVQLRQLGLQAGHHVLQRGQLSCVAGLGLSQSALQRRFLSRQV